jgi:hypothetical protein
MNRRAMTVLAGVLILGTVVSAGGGQAAKQTQLRTTWGEPDLTGVWKAASLGASPGRDTFNLTALEKLYKPAARAKMKTASAKDDPTLRCIPPPFPRAAMLGRQLQIVQKPGFAFVLTEAYPVARIIPTTGRPHTAEQYLFPSYLGDSTARWDGDTLVVDVVSFNGEGWLASGQDKPAAGSTGVWLTSAAMHVTERWRRIDANTLEYRATVEDSQVLTASWQTPAVTFKRQPADRIDEVLCRTEDGPDTYLSRLR